MELTIRTDILRSDLDSPAGTDVRNAATPGDFGSLLAEARQRDAGKDDDDTPPGGAETPVAGSMAPVPPPAQPRHAGGDTGEAVRPANASEPAVSADPAATAGIAGPAPQPDTALSPESFAALLEASPNGSRPAPASALPDTTAAALATPAAAPPVTAGTPAPATVVNVAPPVGSPEWPASFGNTVRILVSDQTQVARLRLSPEDLGPVDVRITLSDHRAEIAFAVSGPEARAAIQQALPQLRDMLADNGLQLGDTTFGDHRPAEQGGTSGGDRPAGDDRAAGTATPVTLRPAAAGLVDLYA